MQQAGEDTLVYRLSSDDVFLLTRESGAVLALCDGSTSESEAQARTGLSSAQLHEVLRELADLELLEGVSRRSVLQRTAVVGGGVVLASIAGPPAFAAVSYVGSTPPGSGSGTGTAETFASMPSDLAYSSGVATVAEGNPSGSLYSHGGHSWVFTGSRYVMGSVITLDLDFLFKHPASSSFNRDIFNVGLWMPTGLRNNGSGVPYLRLQNQGSDGGFFPRGGSLDLPPVAENIWYHLTIVSNGTTVTATVKNGSTTFASRSVALTTLAGTSTPTGHLGQLSDGAATTEGHLVDNIVLS